MTRRLATLSILLLFASAALAFGRGRPETEGAGAWNRIEERGSIIVATSGTLFPASFYSEDDELTGFDVEVMRAVAAELGLDVEFRIMAFDAMLGGIQSGQVDAAVNDINRTAEREEMVDFSEPYKYSFATLMVRADDLSGIETVDDLEGKVHAGEATTTFSRVMRSYGAEILTYDNATNDQYLRDLELGRTDVIMNDYYLQRLAIQFMPEFDVTLHPDLRFWLEPAGSHIVIPNGAEELKSRIDGALSSLREDGTLGEISASFFDGDDVSTRPDVEEEGFIVIDLDELSE
ncbi:MAG: transporter substrate-binding domain-containing protein [Spirochaetia bacterium]